MTKPKLCIGLEIKMKDVAGFLFSIQRCREKYLV